jgi:asparagine synthase (glutamine-hydrolysing)
VILRGQYYFTGQKFLPPDSDTSIISFDKGYIQYDSYWISRESNRSHLFLHRDLRGLKNFSPSLNNHNQDSTSSSYDLVGEDFFSKALSNRILPIGWAIQFDEIKNEVKIAREAFGIIPLYYIHVNHKFIAFATDIPSLLQIKDVKEYGLTLNSDRIRHFLNGTMRGEKFYNSKTIYSEIYSILPSYVSEFTTESQSHKFYNQIDAERWKGLTTVQEFGEVFKELFIKSVNREIQGTSVIGSHLSGGLDSSSICCVVKRENPSAVLHTFFNYTGTKYTDEGKYAKEVANYSNSNHTIIPNPTKEIDSIILNCLIYGQPDQMMSGSSMHDSIITHSSQAQCQVLLTGYDGDGIVGYGSEYIHQLYQQSDWHQLRGVLENTAQHKYLINRGDYIASLEDRKEIVFLYHIYKWLAHSIKSRSLSDSLRILKIAKKVFDIPYHSLLNKGISAYANKLFHNYPQSILSSSFVNEANLYQTTTIPPNFFFKDILFDVSIRFVEQLYIRGAHSGVSTRHPFYDMDLYELCVAVPSKVKYGKNGLTRAHFREAMKGILPETVRTRVDKATFDISVRNATIRQYHQARDFVSESSALWQFVDKKKFKQAVQVLYKEDRSSQQAYNSMSIFVSQAVIFAIWLDNYKKV